MQSVLFITGFRFVCEGLGSMNWPNWNWQKRVRQLVFILLNSIFFFHEIVPFKYKPNNKCFKVFRIGVHSRNFPGFRKWLEIWVVIKEVTKPDWLIASGNGSYFNYYKMKSSVMTILFLAIENIKALHLLWIQI
jgi:hypothetical protein